MERRYIGRHYSISKDGRVFSSKRWRGIDGRELRPVMSTSGYRTVVIDCGDGIQRYKIANLVCAAFHGPKPFPEAVVRHLDDDRLNDNADNLSWGSRSDNSKDAVKNGRCKAAENGRKSASKRSGDRHYLARLSWDDVDAIRSASNSGVKGVDLSRQYGVSPMTISDILRGITWKMEHKNG